MNLPKYLISLFSVFLLCVVQGITYRRVCYFTNWSRWRHGIGKYGVDNVEPFLCTHIVFAFGSFDQSGKVAPFEPGPDEKDYAALSKKKQQNKNLKLLLGFGGWNFGSLRFSNMAANPKVRSKFIFNAVEFLRKYDFDGLDIDWEYPASRGGKPADKTNLVILCKELIEAFKNDATKRGKDRLLLTAAVPANQKTAQKGYDVKALSKYLDFINLMTYDFHGGWDHKTGFNSPLYAAPDDPTPTFNLDAAAKWWHHAGFPKHKITVGFATYGHSFTLSDPSQSGVGAPAWIGPSGPYTRGQGFWSYYEICQSIQKGGNVVFDDDQKVPYYLQKSLWIGYDNELSFTIKTVIDILDDVKPVKTTPTLVEPMQTTARVTQHDESITMTTATTPASQTTGTSAEAFSCIGKSYGMYADSLDCRNFYWCSVKGKRLMSCPADLVWDAFKSYCNFRDLVDLTYSQGRLVQS